MSSDSKRMTYAIKRTDGGIEEFMYKDLVDANDSGFLMSSLRSAIKRKPGWKIVEMPEHLAQKMFDLTKQRDEKAAQSKQKETPDGPADG